MLFTSVNLFLCVLSSGIPDGSGYTREQRLQSGRAAWLQNVHQRILRLREVVGIHPQPRESHLVRELGTDRQRHLHR